MKKTQITNSLKKVIRKAYMSKNPTTIDIAMVDGKLHGDHVGGVGYTAPKGFVGHLYVSAYRQAGYSFRETLAELRRAY